MQRRPTFALAPALCLALAACGQPGDIVDAAPAPDGPTPDAALDAGGADAAGRSAVGYVAAVFRSVAPAAPQLLDATFHPWAPSPASALEVFGELERELYSGAQLAVGQCGPVTKPTAPPVTAVAGGDAIALTAGARTLPLELKLDGSYDATEEADPAPYLAAPLALLAGAGSDAIGGPGTLALGALPHLQGQALTVDCVAGAPCDLRATLDAADELHAAIALGPVCRLAPTGPIAIPASVTASLAIGPHSVRIYAVRRSVASFGSASYEVFLAHELGLGIALAAPAAP